MAIRRRKSLKPSLDAIARAFAEIETALTQLAARVRRAEGRIGRTGRVSGMRRRSLHISAERRAQLKLQGAYMGFMRQLGPRQKTKVKTVKEKRGFHAAIKMARALAGK
jgi:hypothetical protein